MTLIRFLKQASQHGAFAGDEMDFEAGLAAEIVDSGLAEMMPLSKEEKKEAKAEAKAEAKDALAEAKAAEEMEKAAKEVPGARIELPPPPPPTQAEIKEAKAAEKAEAKEAKAEAKAEKAEAKDAAKQKAEEEDLLNDPDGVTILPADPAVAPGKESDTKPDPGPRHLGDVNPEPKAKDVARNEPVKGSWNKP